MFVSAFSKQHNIRVLAAATDVLNGVSRRIEAVCCWCNSDFYQQHSTFAVIAERDKITWKHSTLDGHLVEARLHDPICFVASFSQVLMLMLLKENIVLTRITIQSVAGRPECWWCAAVVHICLRGSFCPSEVD